MDEYIIKATRHPHYGCIGTINEDDRISATNQYIMTLTSCMHGTDRCAVDYEQLDRLSKSNTPYKMTAGELAQIFDDNGLPKLAEVARMTPDLATLETSSNNSSPQSAEPANVNLATPRSDVHDGLLHCPVCQFPADSYEMMDRHIGLAHRPRNPGWDEAERAGHVKAEQPDKEIASLVTRSSHRYALEAVQMVHGRHGLDCAKCYEELIEAEQEASHE